MSFVKNNKKRILNNMKNDGVIKPNLIYALFQKSRPVNIPFKMARDSVQCATA